MRYIKFLIILLATSLANAEALHCRVVGVTDGDTITCLTDKKEQLKIRLYQIDAPEKKQAFGNRSRQALSNMIFNEDVQVITYNKDKYNRILGLILKKDKEHSNSEINAWIDVNISMIMDGMAWYYPFAKKNPIYQEAQNKAKANKKGLWSQKAIAPWDFRKQQRNKR